MAKYDVVVVGAGNAGLTSAVQLALAGKKTLLIEQHNLPGGCASSFRRGRFEFEPSLHEICDFGNAQTPGSVYTLFEQLGVKLDWIEIPECYRCISKYSDGTPMDVTMPAGKDAFIDQMEAYVPGSRQSMEDFFALCEELKAMIAYINGTNGHADSNVLKKEYPNALRCAAYPVNKVFNALKMPKKAQENISTYWGYLGVDLDNMMFLHYSNMVHSYITYRAVMPKHTSHEISQKLVDRFIELGGDVWYNCRAERFLFDGDRCCGVVTNMGQVDCDYVLANINPDIIYGRMVPKEIIPEREKKLSAARNKNYSARMYCSYFALNKSAEELGIKDYTIFFPSTADTVKEYNSMRRVATNNFCISVCYNVLNPEFSPEGTCVVSFTSMYGPEDWNDLTPEQYEKQKVAIAKKFLDIFKEKAGVDLEPHIEEMAIATPWTFARYLGTPEGSVYGYEVSGWDAMMARMMMLGSDYPIKGLRPIGAAGPRGDGYSSAYICGQLMARLALKDLSEGGKQ